MIFKKIFFYIEKKANFLLIILLICTTKVQSEDFFKSYYGSILSGQIAKYNNDNQKAAEFFSIASEKNPKNYNIFESKLMSLILSGNVKKAVEELEKNNQITTNSKIVKLLKFVHFLNSEKYNEAIDYLNKNEDLLISDKIKPIIQSWLSTDLKTSIRYINDFSNKSSGKMLSEIYKSHLAIMYVFYNELRLDLQFEFSIVQPSALKNPYHQLHGI